MPFARTLITAPSASQGPYSISWPYLLTSHVLATVNGSAATLASVNGSQVVFATPTIAQGDDLVIYRQTEQTDPMVDFQPAGPITESNLDTALRQNLYLIQELLDDISSGG